MFKNQVFQFFSLVTFVLSPLSFAHGGQAPDRYRLNPWSAIHSHYHGLTFTRIFTCRGGETNSAKRFPNYQKEPNTSINMTVTLRLRSSSKGAADFSPDEPCEIRSAQLTFNGIYRGVKIPPTVLKMKKDMFFTGFGGVSAYHQLWLESSSSLPFRWGTLILPDMGVWTEGFQISDRPVFERIGDIDSDFFKTSAGNFDLKEVDRQEIRFLDHPCQYQDIF